MHDQNNLDPGGGEKPEEDLVVLAGAEETCRFRGKRLMPFLVAQESQRDETLDAIRRETLSSFPKSTGCAKEVLVPVHVVVPHWATWEHRFDESC